MYFHVCVFTYNRCREKVGMEKIVRRFAMDGPRDRETKRSRDQETRKEIVLSFSDILDKFPEQEQFVFQDAEKDFQVDFLIAMNNEISESDHILTFGSG